MAGLVAVSVLMLIFLDYDKGWDWATYTYTDFWTLAGFTRNLLFNGWHPVMPWFAFILFGIRLSRLDLGSVAVRRGLMVFGAATLFCVIILSSWLTSIARNADPEAAILFQTSPVPPVPFYIIAGASFSCMIIGVCLYLESPLRQLNLLRVFTLPGRQTLTLYIAHILIGMGVMEAFGFIDTQSANQALWASALFCIAAVVYCLIWSKAFSRGPLEMLMRRVT